MMNQISGTHFTEDSVLALTMAIRELQIFGAAHYMLNNSRYPTLILSDYLVVISSLKPTQD